MRRFVILPQGCMLGLVLLAFITGCAERDVDEPGASNEQQAPFSVPAAANQLASPPTITDAGWTEVSFELGDAVAGCNIELVDGRNADGFDVEVAQGRPVVIEGWSIPYDGEPMQLHLSLPDGTTIEVGTVEAHHRPDLVGMVGQQVASTAGFRATLTLPDGVAGRIGMFIAPASGARRVHCASGRGFVVVDP